MSPVAEENQQWNHPSVPARLRALALTMYARPQEPRLHAQSQVSHQTTASAPAPLIAISTNQYNKRLSSTIPPACLDIFNNQIQLQAMANELAGVSFHFHVHRATVDDDFRKPRSAQVEDVKGEVP